MKPTKNIEFEVIQSDVELNTDDAIAELAELFIDSLGGEYNPTPSDGEAGDSIENSDVFLQWPY